MRDEARIGRILKLLYRVWNKNTNQDLRLMQLILNATQEDDVNKDLFSLEDDVLENKIRNFYNDKI